MKTLNLSAIKDQLKDKNGFIDTYLIKKYIFEKFSNYKFKDPNRGSYISDNSVFALQQGIDWCNKKTYFIKVELIRNPLTDEKTAYLNIDPVYQ